MRAFCDFFEDLGYRSVPAVAITSGVDSSVNFIGSTISVLKPLLISHSIPPEGVYIVQPALRSRNLKAFYDDGSLPQWASYFVALGTLARVGRLPEVHHEIWTFFWDRLGVDRARIVGRVSSLDEDLLELLRESNNEPAVEVDGCEPSRFRHRYGLERFTGRNYNFAIRSMAGELSDVGNLIVIEEGGLPCAVELGFGVFTLLAQLHNLEHPIQAMPVTNVGWIRNAFDVKLIDALVAAVVLIGEGLRPNATGRGTALSRYLQALSFLRFKSGRSLAELEEWAEYICESPGQARTGIPAAITRYLADYEAAVRKGLPRTIVNQLARTAFRAGGLVSPPAGWTSVPFWRELAFESSGVNARLTAG